MKAVEGKIAIVTGAGNGMGKGVAKLLAAEGAKVLVNDIGKSKETGEYLADITVKEITEAGGIAVANYDDISTVENDQKIVAQCVDAFGGVDILALVAGIIQYVPIDEMTEADWDRTMNINTKSLYGMVHYAVPYMKKNNYGRIVIYSSRSAFGKGNSVSYCASKGAALSMTEALNYELTKHGILCNAVIPSSVTTLFPQERAAYGGTPKPDPATPDMVAPMTAYLCSEKCDFSGEAWYIAGCDVALYPRERLPLGLIRKGNKEKWTIEELETMIPETFNMFKDSSDSAAPWEKNK